jgi:hypothetical protein
MVVFYLCLNYILPFFDDVIISMQNHSMNLLIGENDIGMKNIKRKRMINFLKTLKDNDILYFEKDSNLLVIDYSELSDDIDNEFFNDNDFDTDSQDGEDPHDHRESRKRHREDDNDDNNDDDEIDCDKNIKCEINRIFDIVNSINTDIKNKCE